MKRIPPELDILSVVRPVVAGVNGTAGNMVIAGIGV